MQGGISSQSSNEIFGNDWLMEKYSGNEKVFFVLLSPAKAISGVFF